ncbi:MAG: beta-lactamase family protein, partial [Chloroflexota bacterium]|nr:beta-lactamase family protein [Chloroflexota bacterium]
SSVSLMEQRHIELEPDLWYGYGVELRDVTGRSEVVHRGGTAGFVGYLSRFPDDDVVIVLLANAESVDVDQLRNLLVLEVLSPSSS